MTAFHTRRRLLAATVPFALLVAACGGDDGDATVVGSASTESSTTTEADTTTTTEADTTTTTEDGTADAEALAGEVILVADDFSEGWVAEDSADDDVDLLDCVSSVDLDTELEANVDSQDFSQESGSDLIGVGSTGLVFADEPGATALIDEAGSNAFAGCALDIVLDGFTGSGATVNDADLSPAPGVAPLGDQSAALNGFFSLQDPEGNPLEGELSLWLIRTGPVVTGVSVLDVGETEFATVVDEVTTVVAAKQAAAVG